MSSALIRLSHPAQRVDAIFAKGRSNTMSTTKHILSSALIAASLALHAGNAAAQTCTTDKDCPQSFACVQSGVVSGTTAACPPNADCPKAEPAPAPTPYYSCEPKACGSDADCGPGMVCFTTTSTACSGGAAVPPCAPGADCPAPEKIAPTCTTTMRSACAFKWQLPCKTDTECGDGFNCMPSVIGVCSGSSGSASAGSASAGSGSTGAGGSATSSPKPPADAGTSLTSNPSSPPDAVCTTMTVYPGSCNPKVAACVADAECPSNWTCPAAPSPTSSPPASAVDTPAVDGGAAADARSSNAGTAAGPAGVASPVRVCWPPYGLGVRAGDSKGETSNGQVSGSSGNATSGGGTGSTPVSPTMGAGAGSPTNPSGGGCSIDTTNETSRTEGLVLLTLLGLIAVRRLRRS